MDRRVRLHRPATASLRDGLGAWLERWSGRPPLFAVAAINAITGLAMAAVLGPLCFGDDAGFYRRCAQIAVDAHIACGSLYPPLVALVARPLTWVSPTLAAVIMPLIGLATLMTGVRLESRRLAPVDRVLVAIAALGFAPVVHEILLGQVTFLIAAAIYPVVRRADAFRTGIARGMALAPKPLLIAVLVWMMVWRRRALTATVVTALVLTFLSFALLGPDQYGKWVSVLMQAGHESVAGTFSLSLAGNYSLWPLDPARLALAAVICVVTLWTIVRDRSRGFVAALLASLLLAPYTGLYAASILLLAVKPALQFAPRATRVLALVANPALALLHALAVWSGVGLIACVPGLRRHKASRPAGGP